jgi:outer membrane protein assembly factor BamE (lipoprotein component of BamABCDE complex)
MVLPKGRIAVAGLAVTLLLGGCARTIEHKGYIADEVLVSGIQPGVDNRDSVAATLGRPTFTGQFDQRDWYYVSRLTRQLAFSMPKPIQQTVVHIRFDDQGNVASIERTGLEKIASISPMDDKTPTLGRDRSFFRELFRGVTPSGVGGTGGTGQ